MTCLPPPGDVSDLLRKFIHDVTTVDTEVAGASTKLVETIVNLLHAILAVTLEPSEQAGPPWKHQKVHDSFAGVRSAVLDLCADLPASLPGLCRGLAFAAGVLHDALSAPGSIVSAGMDPGVLLRQLPEPAEPEGVSASHRTVTRLQCVEVLAAGFFGVIRRSSSGERRDTPGAEDMPEFTFEHLWHYSCDQWSTKNFVLMGVLLYFQQAASTGATGLQAEEVVVTRKAVGAASCAGDGGDGAALLCPVDFMEDGISIHGYGGPANLQADFANEYLGGGVLRGGGSQEESMFVEYTELLVTMFLVERMLPHEAVEVAGLKKYVEHNMMAARHLRDKRAQFCRPAAAPEEVTTVALDAINYNSHGTLKKWSQYEPAQIRRELRKCMAALARPPHGGCPSTRSFVTGLWGCGAFRGDAEMKFVIQWVACSLEPSVARMVFCPWDQRAQLVKCGILELIARLEGRVSAAGVLQLLLSDPGFARARSTFGFLLKKLGPP